MSLGLKPTWMVTLYVTLTSSLSYNCRFLCMHTAREEGEKLYHISATCMQLQAASLVPRLPRFWGESLGTRLAGSCNAGCMLAACTKALSTQERARWNYPETMGVRASEHAQSVYLTLWRCVHFSAIQYLNLTRKWIHAARKWFQFTHT